MEAPDFWDDAEKASASMKEVKDLKSVVERADKLSSSYEDIMTLIEMGNEENDESLIPEVEQEYREFCQEFDDLRITTMLTGEHDSENAILTLHAGAGGTESCDWASMLCRMYERWADRKGFSVKVLDSLDGDEAGLKSVTLEIQGENVYGYLKSEHGVHRLVRRFFSTSPRDFMLPSLSVRLIPYFSIAVAMVSVGEAILAMAVFNAVPAMLPLTLALAIRPSARDVSSML